MINFSQFTLNNQGVKDLNEVLFTTAFKNGNVFNTATAMTGVENGKKLDFVDNIGNVGVAGRSCNPTYTDVSVLGAEKTWALGDWHIAKQICYTELESTIAKFSLKGGTDRDNLQGSDFYNQILLPLLDKALEQMYWRMIWFGDTAAKNVSASGVITNGVDVNFFKMADGLWKRLFAIVSADATKRVTIAANSQTTYANQKSGIRTAGVAQGIADNLLMNADSRIGYASDATLMMTRSLYEALRKDYANTYKQTIPFMEVADGVSLPHYDGVPILVVPEWDNNIAAFEDSGTALNLPHRAVYASPSNLMVGTKDTSTFADMVSGFNDQTRVNYFYAASNIGTLVGEDNLVQVAY